MNPSVKTTTMGVIAAIGLLCTALTDALRDGWSTQDYALIASAIGIALQGIFSRDDNISSEGTKIQR